MEEWRPVPGYEGYYEVSNAGNIRSVERYVKAGDHLALIKSQEMKQHVGTNGYPIFGARKDGTHKHLSVHRCVAEAFIENPYNNPTVNHIDGDKNNNDVSNLEWVTYSENLLHAYRNALRHSTAGRKQEKFHCANIPPKDELIAVLIEVDCNLSEVGRIYNVTSTAVAKWCRKYRLPKGKPALKQYVKCQRSLTAKPPTCNRKIVGANPTVGSTTPQSPGGLHDSCR